MVVVVVASELGSYSPFKRSQPFSFAAATAATSKAGAPFHDFLFLHVGHGRKFSKKVIRRIDLLNGLRRKGEGKIMRSRLSLFVVLSFFVWFFFRVECIFAPLSTPSRCRRRERGNSFFSTAEKNGRGILGGPGRIFPCLPPAPFLST